MRYGENKEQSGELLRLTLSLMGKQDAAYHPVSYQLWYEHVAGINPALSKALDERLNDNRPLTEDEVHALHTRFIVSRVVDRMEQLQQKLRTLLEEVSRTATEASEKTGQFEIVLESSRNRLAQPAALENVRSIVGELVSETAKMHAATQTVSERLEAKALEVGALTEQLERAQSEALSDPLTGLANRRAFDRTLAEFCAHPDEAALLLIDIDHFKAVNDAFGHLLGDKVLRAIAHTLQTNIKGRDMASRLAGDEFAVLLRQTALPGALKLAEQLCTAVHAGRLLRDGKAQAGTVSVSIGMTMYRPGDDPQSLVARADAALYRAKNEGRNCVRSTAASSGQD